MQLGRCKRRRVAYMPSFNGRVVVSEDARLVQQLSSVILQLHESSVRCTGQKQQQQTALHSGRLASVSQDTAHMLRTTSTRVHAHAGATVVGLPSSCDTQPSLSLAVSVLLFA